MPGLIEQKLQTPLSGTSGLPDDERDSANTVLGYEADQIQLDEEKDTVAGRINSVIAKNSPLMQAARTSAAQTANRRGLVNSSIGVQAGEQAVLNTALPIAQQDASTSYDARKTNSAANNAASSQMLSGAQQLQQGREAGSIQSRLQGEQGNIQSRLQAEQGQIQQGQTRLAGEIESGLMSQQGDIQSRLQAEKATIDERLITADGAMREQLLARQGEIDAELTRLSGSIQSGQIAQQGQIQSQLQAEKAQIDADLINADAAAREQLLARQGQIDAELARIGGEIETGLLRERGQIDLQLQNADAASRQQLLTRQGEIDMALAEQRGDIEGQLQAERGVIELQLQEAEGQVREQLLTRQGEIDANLQDMRTQGALEVADLEGQWRNLLQTSQSATVFYSEIAQQIGGVLQNEKIKVDQKQSLINTLRTQLEDGLSLIGTIGDVDLAGLLEFGNTGTSGSGYDSTAEPYPGIIERILRSGTKLPS